MSDINVIAPLTPEEYQWLVDYQLEPLTLETQFDTIAFQDSVRQNSLKNTELEDTLVASGFSLPSFAVGLEAGLQLAVERLAASFQDLTKEDMQIVNSIHEQMTQEKRLNAQLDKPSAICYNE